MTDHPDTAETDITHIPAPRAQEDRHERRGRIHLGLRLLEATPTEPLRATTYLGPSGYRTYASPYRFAGSDGGIYRVKARAQQGLGAEMLCNRLANRLAIGPETRVIDVGGAVLPRDRHLDHLVGLRLATAEVDSAFNDEELRDLEFEVDPKKIDWHSWALVVALHTWVYAGDPQAVLRMTDGRVLSVDHGDCFRQLTPGKPTGLIVPSLHGIDGATFDVEHVVHALREIESLREDALIRVAAGIPGDHDGWRMPLERKIRVIDWLIERQLGIREVMVPWMPMIS